MYLFLIAVVICLFVVVIIFSSPRLSPIPYFPSNGKDMPLILQALNIRNNQTIVDLGAGDGIVIYAAATQAFQNKLNTKFIAVEINPILLLVLHIRRLLHPNRKNIQIIKADMFSMKFSPLIASHYPLTTFYLYISPWFIEKTIINISSQIQSFDLVSYFYQVKCLPEYKEEIKKGVHKVYSYQPLVTNH